MLIWFFQCLGWKEGAKINTICLLGFITIEPKEEQNFGNYMDNFTMWKIFVRIQLRDIPRFAESQQNAKKKLGYNLGTQEKFDANAIVHASAGAVDEEYITIRDIEQYVLQNTPNFPQQTLLREHKISRAQTKLSYGRSVGVEPMDA